MSKDKSRAIAFKVVNVIKEFNTAYTTIINQFLEKFLMPDPPPIIDIYTEKMNDIIKEIDSGEKELVGTYDIAVLNRYKHIKYLIDVHYAQISIICANHNKVQGVVLADAPLQEKRILIPLLNELVKHNNVFTHFIISQLNSI